MLLAPVHTGGRIVFVSAVLAVVSGVSALSFVQAVTRVNGNSPLVAYNRAASLPHIKTPLRDMLSPLVELASVSSTVLSYEAFEAEQTARESLP